MDMLLYLLLGMVVAGVLACRTNKFTLGLVCLYWFATTVWMFGLIRPVDFHVVSWVPLLDINFAYRLDGLSRLFSLLIAGIGILIFVYAWFYTEDKPENRRKLFSLLQLFAVSMQGLVLANDMVVLFLHWESTSILSYLLIQFNVRDKQANQAAFNSLFVSVMGGLVLLTGFIILNHLANTWRITTAISLLAMSQNGFLEVAFLCVMCGVVTKSAQFPFYFWLTGAMKAPTPVSAYLHSATMVNAGIYILARFHPMFSQLPEWYPTLAFFGLTTIALSSFLSVFSDDLKAILAYTTIFALGVMVYLLSGTEQLKLEAFAIFLLFHGIYKAGAFTLVGILDKEYGTRLLHELRGVARHRVVLAITSIIIFGAMAGVPPFFGFTMKEMIYQAKLAKPSISYYRMGISMVSSMLIAAASFRCLWYLFHRDIAAVIYKRKAISPSIYWCPILLAALIIFFNILTNYIEFIIEPAVMAMSGSEQVLRISPNTTSDFLLSLATSIGGVVCFVILIIIKPQPGRFIEILQLKDGFERGLGILLKGGKILTELTQGLRFNTQFRLFYLSLVGLFALVLGLMKSGSWHLSLNTPSLLEAMISVSLIIAAMSLLFSYRFLHNLVSLSLVGFATSCFFIVNGAVDVAITQLLVEVLTIIIMLLAFRSVRILERSKESAGIKIINGLIAGGMGALVSMLMVSLNSIAFNQRLADFFINNSLTKAYGKNVVNVILVDFRSLDTYGEVIVIVTTVIGVAFLLKQFSMNK